MSLATCAPANDRISVSHSQGHSLSRVARAGAFAAVNALGMEPSMTRFRFVTSILVGVITGCTSDQTASPVSPRVRVLSLIDCAASCVLANNTAPLRAAWANPDSAHTTIALGQIVLSGNDGDSVTLRASGASALGAVGGEEQLVVRTDGMEARYSFGELAAGVTVYRFTTSRAVELSYAITRAVRTIPGDEDSFSLVELAGNARVVSSNRPWVRRNGLRTIFAPASCVVNQQNQVVCGDSVSVSLFYSPPSGNIGGTFTSTFNSGSSKLITVLFSKPVRLGTIKIYDPTYAGNQAIAYDSTGTAIGSISFPFSGQPGVNHPSEMTLARRMIRRIDLIPADTDYVAYDLSFELDSCPALQDSVLNTAQVQNALKQALSQSNPDSVPGTGKISEHGGAIYKMADGSIQAFQITDPTIVFANECTWYFLKPPPAVPGSLYAFATFHTHPAVTGQDVYGCPTNAGQTPTAQTLGDGKLVPQADPDAGGGGSPSDWGFVNSEGMSNYVINQIGHIWRLDPNVPPNQRNSNTNEWQWKKPTTPGCVSKGA